MAKKTLKKKRKPMAKKTTTKRAAAGTAAPLMATASYQHPTADSPLRPDVGTQAQFRKKKPPVKYRYDSSLSPALDWDGQNPAREQGEQQIAAVEQALAAAHAELAEAQQKLQRGPADARLPDRLKAAADNVARAAEANRALKAMSRPFLNWCGKAERLSFDVPTLPLFVHERLSTAAIVQTLQGHKKDQQLALFADPQHSIADQVLRAYEHRDKWVNRMMLGDSLVVMNSLLRYESLGGQVQMIYMDPPYGIKFGSNFQPFVRKRDVSHNDDDDMTREPEMVKAYRDTWELGLHSYLTYMRDRLLLARDLLAPTGSIFVQISDDNLHHVRELLDEIFRPENSVAVIPFRKKTMPLGAKHIESICDYILWYARDKERMKYRPIFERMSVEGDTHWNYVELPDGSRRKMTKDEINNHRLLPAGSTPCQLVSLYPAGVNQGGLFPFKFRGKTYRPPDGNSWFTNEAGMNRLTVANRLEPYEDGDTLRYVLKLSDSPVTSVTNMWDDTSAPSDKAYVVQTNTKVIQRCLLMTTDPGDLVLDPTCGGGTTAYMAENWGRRWITCDVSRVPLALARQRLLTATFPWYELRDEPRGPAAGFVYKRRQNNRGEEVGGIIPYVSKGSVANDEPAEEEVLVDRPEEAGKVTRVTGPFALEATMPTPVDWEGDGQEDSGTSADESFAERMLEVLRKSPVLSLEGNRRVTLRNVRQPAKTLSLSAEAMVEGHVPGTRLDVDEAVQVSLERSGKALPFTGRPVAFVFGPENGPVSEKLVYEAAREAHAKSYTHLYVIGFAIQPNARKLIDDCEAAIGVPATYVQATPDLMMGDLLKNMRTSQIFSVCGLPEVEVKKLKDGRHQVKLLGVDVFDPATMENDSRGGDDVPAWFLDTDYNGLCFHVCQAFFPRTAAWDHLKKALRGTYDEGVWDHLAGSTSAPFETGDHKQIAVKVIDDRGNELMVVKELNARG